MYVEVAVNLPPVRGTFDYHVPAELEGQVQPGHLVTAPFGKRRLQGVVISLPEKPQVPETKPIEGLVDPQPVLSPAQIQLARWLQGQTLAPLIDCLTLMIPPGLSKQADSLYTLEARDRPLATRTEKRIVDLLRKRGALRGRQIQRSLSRFNWRPAADALVRKGILRRKSVLDPPSVSRRKIRNARLAALPDQAKARVRGIGRRGSQAYERRVRIIDALIQEPEPVEVSWIYAQSGGNSGDLRALEDHGLIIVGDTEVWRDPLESVEVLPKEPPKLTADQSAAWRAIQQGFQADPSGRGRSFLLHGVTGSGKTEIYLRAVREALDRSRSAIVLVPEIALTPQTVRRFLTRFPGQVGLMHSRLSEGERYDTWRRCRQGLLQVVIGARSALFSPLPNIGLIVLDESHDESYKEQSGSVRHHARETALEYAGIMGAVCLLGSATPDVVTRYRAVRGEMQYLHLPQRILGHRERIESQAERWGITPRYRHAEAEAETIDLPPVRVIDMRHELKAGNSSIFSRLLQEQLDHTLQRGSQAILFLNRRGSATYVFCRDCGQPLRCSRCDTPLAYHSASEQLFCHHCGLRRSMPDTCPNCGSRRIKQFGAGTQRVETEVTHLFPAARTIRWDQDATHTKGSHQIILDHFAAHRADVLIGTQMIAKGLDLPLVTLVGVVSSDTALNLPDYRAAERTFQVLTQVAGRAGRGLLGGKVILQTYQPDHYAIRAAANHDYSRFFQQELIHRRNLRYPPFIRLARLLYRDFSESRAQTEAEHMAVNLRQRIGSQQRAAELIGPAPCFFRRVRGNYRWHIILRAADPASILPHDPPQGWTLDIDPVSLL
jgi:primosomal protein N' (replication factor Y)